MFRKLSLLTWLSLPLLNVCAQMCLSQEGSSWYLLKMIVNFSIAFIKTLKFVCTLLIWCFYFFLYKIVNWDQTVVFSRLYVCLTQSRICSRHSKLFTKSVNELIEGMLILFFNDLDQSYKINQKHARETGNQFPVMLMPNTGYTILLI